MRAFFIYKDVFKEWLFSEGLVKIPPVMFYECRDVFVREIFGCINKLLEGKRKEHPKHATAFNNAKQRFNLTPAKYDGKNKVYEVDYNLSGLPDKIAANFQHRKPVLTLYLDWEGKVIPGLASYFDVGRSGEPVELIGINLSRFKKYLRSDPQDVFYYINAIESDLRHELMHMVQYRSLQHLDKSQVRKNYSAGKGKEYYTSEVEFSPQIDSAVHDFLTYQPEDANKAFRIYVGIDKPAFLTGVQPSPFFQNLKWHAPERYRKAVKLFYTQLLDKKEIARPAQT